MATPGSYRIWTADHQGDVVDGPDPDDPKVNPFPVPTKAAAVDIYFGLADGAPPPSKEQGELQGDVDRVLGVVRRLYLDAEQRPTGKFRHYYVRLFRLAQLGLEGSEASPEVAKAALATVTRDLIDDEAGRVKNGHMLRLGKVACLFALPFALLYAGLTLPEPALLEPHLSRLGIVRTTAANFMLLWLGCFLGVWLSYGIRTTTITLTDLVGTDADRLLPRVRMVFTGTLTMILGLLCVMGLVEVKIGSYAITSIADNAMLAFVVGAFCGIAEASLPAAVSRRAADFVDQLK